jgi:hypothetical protein
MGLPGELSRALLVALDVAVHGEEPTEAERTGEEGVLHGRVPGNEREDRERHEGKRRSKW